MQSTNETQVKQAIVNHFSEVSKLIMQLNDEGSHATTSIGIGITTHNRPEQFNKSYATITRLAPIGAKVVVVDDASAKPVDVATYRFIENVGIARAKNKCLELLEDCDHIFLFDDDTFPTTEDWYKPYINSGEAHLMYIFPDFKSGQGRLNDTTTIYQDDKIVAYSHPRGCMLYLTKEALKAAGGMRPEFGRWGYEHPDLSNRIFNKGLTRFRYMDVVGSDKLFYSGDENRTVQSSVSDTQRSQMVMRNKPLYEQYFDDVEYIPYKAKRNALITCMFTNLLDPQRGQKWGDEMVVKMIPLIESAKAHGWDVVVLTDTSINSTIAKVVRVQASINPYFQRWISYYDYLRKHIDEYGDVFCVDATDVEMLNTPYTLNKGKLYVGFEPEILATDWMVNHHKSPVLADYMATNKSRMLLNAGVVGGDAEMLLKFVHKMVDNYCKLITLAHTKNAAGPGDTDMALFNYTCDSFSIVTGGQVVTDFKKEERNNYSWFKHK